MRKMLCKISDRETLQASLLQDKPRKVKFTPAYSGGKMYTSGIGIPEPLEFDGFMYPEGTRIPTVANLESIVIRSQNIPILYGHNGEYRLGHTVKLSNDGESISGEGLLESPSQWRSEIVESFKTGARWQSSIGSGLIDPTQKTLIKPGEIRHINGRDLVGPFILLDRLELMEISIVPAGADPQTEVLLASIQRNVTMTFEEFCASKGFEVSTLDEVNLKALEALYNEANPKEGDPTLPTENLEAEGEAEEKKEENLEAEGESETVPEKKDLLEAEGESACEEKKEEKVQAAVRRSAGPRGVARVFQSLNAPRFATSHTEEAPKRSDVLQASALLTLGIPAEWLTSKKGGYSRRCVDQAEREQIQTGMLSIMGETLQASGIRVDYRNPKAIVERYKTESLYASGVSTNSFGDINVFTPILDKQMRYKYERLESIWQKLYKKRVVRDFNEVATVDFDVTGQAKTLIEHEDFPTVLFKSSGAKFATMKQGVVAGISFESQINDDMGALDSVGDELINMLYDIQVDLFWNTFWSTNSTNFTTAKGNKITKALSVDGLSLAKKAFGSIKNSNGRFLHVPPKFLLVPLALEDVANNLFSWQWAGEDNTKGNIHVGKYEVVTDPYIGSEGGYSGATDTCWFMCGDTTRYPLGEYAVLSGYETPTIKETWYDHKDGLNLRALGTIGFHAYSDKLAAVFSTGTTS